MGGEVPISGTDPDFRLKTGFGGLDIFLSKFDLDGNYQWGHRIGGITFDCANSLAVSGNGNVYITGYFQDIVDFDPGPSSDLKEALSSYDIFLSKFGFNGSYFGTKTWGNTYWGSGLDSWGLVTNNFDFVFLTGSFGFTVDFDPSSYGTDYRTSNGSTDIFLMGL